MQDLAHVARLVRYPFSPNSLIHHVSTGKNRWSAMHAVSASVMSSRAVLPGFSRKRQNNAGRVKGWTHHALKIDIRVLLQGQNATSDVVNSGKIEMVFPWIIRKRFERSCQFQIIGNDVGSKTRFPAIVHIPQKASCKKIKFWQWYCLGG